MEPPWKHKPTTGVLGDIASRRERSVGYAEHATHAGMPGMLWLDNPGMLHRMCCSRCAVC